jgi:hypothetical protein
MVKELEEYTNKELEKYPEIKRHIGEEWLRKECNKIHPIFGHLNETVFLNNFDKYLKDIPENKSIRDDLRNGEQFYNVYYEVEIAYFLRELGVSLELHKKIGETITDLFLQKDRIVIEVCHLQPHHKVLQGATPIGIAPKGVAVQLLNTKKMKDYIEKKAFQNTYPNIVCFATDLRIGEGDCDDLFDLYNNFEIRKEVYTVAMWKYQKIQCLYNNPCEKKIQLKSAKLRKFFCQK